MILPTFIFSDPPPVYLSENGSFVGRTTEKLKPNRYKLWNHAMTTKISQWTHRNIRRVGAAALFFSVPVFSVLTLLALVFAFFFLETAAWGADESDALSQGVSRALVIGVARYNDPSIGELPFIKNDTGRITDTLHELGNYAVRGVYESDNPRVRFPEPTRKNIETVLHKVCRACRENDTLLVYISSHGLALGSESFILPQDTVRGDTATYLAISEIRSVMNTCRAKQKFLFIDACFAGNAGKNAGSSETSDSADAQKESRERFLSNLKNASVPKSASLDTPEKSGGIFILASSTSFQESWNYLAKDMSLFTYWLNEGIRGHADADSNGHVTTRELFDYVHGNVQLVKENQTPVMDQENDSDGDWTVIVPKPVTRDRLLENIADRIETVMELRHIKKAGVMRFAFNNNSGTAKGLSIDFSLLLNERLRRQQRNLFLEYDRFQKELETCQITPKNWRERLNAPDDALSALPDLIITGNVTEQANRVCHVDCSLIDRTCGETIHSIHGKTTLSELEAFVGEGFSGEFTLPADEYPIEIADVSADNADAAHGPPAAGYCEEKIGSFDSIAETPHPLLSEKPKFDVWVEVKQQNGSYLARPFYSIAGEPNNLYVPLSSGEVFRLAMRSRLDADTGMVAFLDGRGTLPERDAAPTPEVGSSRTNESSGSQSPATESSAADSTSSAPMVRPNHTRHWIIRKDATVYLPGFFSTIYENGKLSDYNEFLVSDAPDA